jgi:uncharacterized protein YjbJ (UPF0337 family)
MAEDRKHPDDTVSEEASAFGQRVKGATKDAVGAVTGNERLEREGERENAAGRARQANNSVFEETDGVPNRTVDKNRPSDVRNSAAGSLAEETAATGERVKGRVKDVVGDITDNKRLEREGERENAEGRARQARNDVFGSSGSNWVTGMYSTPDAAGRAYDDLTKRHGYKSSDVNVLMSDATRKQHFADRKPGHEFDTGTKAAEGAGIGGGVGLGVGAALGALVAAATSIAIPGLGLIVAGPIAGAIAGAGAGGATGTIVGALVGMGIPEDRAAEYDRGLREGGIVLGTRARDAKHAAELERDFNNYGARNVIR